MESDFYTALICHHCSLILSVQLTNLPEIPAPLLGALLQPTSAFGMMNQKTIQSFHATFLARFLPQLNKYVYLKLKPTLNRPIIYRILPSSPTLHSTSSIILPSIGSETTSSSAFSIDPGPSNSSKVQGGYELIRLLSQGVELGNHQGFFTTRHCSTHLASRRC